MHCIETTSEAISYLSAKDKALHKAMEQIGPISRNGDPDVFTSLISAIASQQISGKAARTIWARLEERLDGITCHSIAQTDETVIQACGLSFKKVSYMKSCAAAVLEGRLDLEKLHDMEDEEIIRDLVALPGIGVWTAEMILIFSLNRPDVLSYNDLGIRKGLMKLYHHTFIDKKRFERYRKRYSPYGTTASLYLWELAIT
ncbi:MAG: DNA-3-methyladenine glycosylase [Sphaerochaetaceae bacterium]